MQVPVASREVHGTCSTACKITVFGGLSTTITEKCSDGSSTTHTGNTYTPPGSGFNHLGKACKWSVPEGYKIGGFSYADGNGLDGIAFLDAVHFATHTPVPLAMAWVKFISNQTATCTYGSGSFILWGTQG
eukprot:gene57884-biopygen6539